jgi:RNA polymerase sigma-70 factor (ECF subfamily)
MVHTDEELVRRHLLGDKRAFPALLSRHIRSIYNLAYRSTGDVMEAENIVQETFARAYAALPTCQPGTPFKPWLLTIAVNLCRNWARQAQRRPVDLLSPVPDGGDPRSLDQVPDPGPGPLEALLQGEANAALEAAVAALPLPYRQAIVLRYMEGLSYAELSQTLCLPLNTVRTHLLRARERLRRALPGLLERDADGLSEGANTPGPLPGRSAEPEGDAAGARPPAPLPGLSEQGV